MKINYKILWIEDHFKEVEPFITNLKNKLNNIGFQLDIDRRATLTKSELSTLNDRLSNYNPYDIIIFDYDLGTRKGDDIAYELRTSIYTDMIFYSGTAGDKLREILFNKNIEGVYTVDRSNFIDDTWPIIEDQIKRICDINNMRGVLLDEMSKIDLEIRNIYKEKYDNLSIKEKEEQLNKVKENLTIRIQNIENQVSELNTESFSKTIIKPTKIEFNTIRKRLKRTTDNELFGEQGELKNKQDLRNKFAHNTAEFNEEQGTVSLSGFEETYSFSDFTKIRKELIDLSKKIKDV